MAAETGLLRFTEYASGRIVRVDGVSGTPAIGGIGGMGTGVLENAIAVNTTSRQLLNCGIFAKNIQTKNLTN